MGFVRLPPPNINAENSNASILCNMCLGGILSHERGWQFRSPFVNLMIPADEFIELISDLRNNLNSDFTDITKGNKYPIGLLGGRYHVHFIHYKTYQEAVGKWRERCKRIDYENLYVILVQTASCTENGLQQFATLPYRNKVALVSSDHPSSDVLYPLKKYDGKNINGEILSAEGWKGRHLYDSFNWNKFFKI